MRLNTMKAEGRPAVVISLDFEMRWGMHDRLGLQRDAYRKNLENERSIIVPELLRLFRERNIRATWAAVGALGCNNWNEYFARAPEPPKYHNSTLAISNRYADMDPEGALHFTPELLQAIHTTPGQELGTHTFSHIFMQEPGITAENVAADLMAVIRLWNERFGFSPRSLVFPRNQAAFLDTVLQHSIRIWRGNEAPWYYNSYSTSKNTILPKALRLLDSLNPLAKRASILEANMTRSSLFLRINLPQYAWWVHSARIRRELATLKPGEIFHLWWHPHNLGGNVHQSLSRLEHVLDMIAERCHRSLLSSLAMGDLV